MDLHRSLQTVSVLLSLGLIAACSDGPPPPLPPDPGDTPFWQELDFAGAANLGHEVRQLEVDEQVAPGPITMLDVTEAAGLGNAVSGGNSHGVGIGFVDVNGDELPDIFVANGKIVGGDSFSSALYINQGDGTFRDETGASGVGGILGDRDCYSVAAGDYDNDGAIDLYIGAQPNDVLLRNCSTDPDSPCFEDATSAAGAGGPASNPDLVANGKSKVVAFGDFDNDGDLDIASSSSTLPRPFAYLLRNDGDGTFTDISADTGIRAAFSGNPCAIMWSDHDNDGDADLWIWNDRGGHILLRNEAGERFEDITESSRLDQITITNPMGIDAADIDHDGDLDYYISNIGNNPLLRNNSDGTFVNITDRAGTGGDYGWGLAFEDFDGDSFADIFVAQEDNRPNLVFHNRGEESPSFDRIEVPHPGVISGSNAHNVAAAFADYDLDGRVDVVRATTDGSRISLYRNQTDPGSHNWLHVLVRPPDGAESRDGIGARVAVATGDLIQFRDVTGGSSRASQNELSVRFGLGNYTGADWVAVLWPSGRQIVVTNVEGGQKLVLPVR